MNVYEEFKLYEDMWNEVENSTELPHSAGIYCIIFDVIDDTGNNVERKYVGQARNIKTRIEEHKKVAKRGSRDYLVHHAMQTYPYKVIVLEECQESQLNLREQHWISTLHTYIGDPNCRGYNMTAGGQRYIVLYCRDYCRNRLYL